MITTFKLADMTVGLRKMRAYSAVRWGGFSQKQFEEAFEELRKKMTIF